MLQTLRDKSKSWIGILLAGFMILLFALWGAEGIFQTGFTRSDPVIEVGSADISGTEFDQIYRRSMAQIERQRNTSIDYAAAKRTGILESIVSDVIEWTLLDQAALDAGLTVSDNVVAAEIRGNPNFQLAGSFNQDYYLEQLRRLGMSEQQFVAELRREIRRNYMIFATSSARPGASTYMDALFRHRRESRNVQVAVVSFDSVSRIPDPTDAQLREIYEANEDVYTAPEYRKVNLLVVSREMLAERQTVSEQEVRAEYEDRKDSEFTRPEMRIVEHILFPDEETARRAHAELEGGKSFPQIAQEIEGARLIDLGSVARDTIPVDSLRDAAFEMAEPGFSSPVASPFGWHIVRVAAIQPQRVQPLEEVRAQIEQSLKQQAARRALDELRIRLEDLLDEGNSLQEIAGAVNAPIRTIEAIDAEGQNPQGATIQGLPVDSEFLRRVFIFREGEISDVHESGEAALYMMQVESITPSRLKGLDEVRAALEERWNAQQRERIARERAEEIANRVRAGINLEQAARSQNAVVQTSRFVARGQPSSPEGISNALQAQAFRAPEGEPFIAEAEGGVAVGVVREILPVEVDRESEAYQEMVQNFRVSLAGEIAAQYTAELRDRFPVEVHQDRIDELLGAGP